MNIVEIIDEATRRGASDIHITVGTPVTVRYRGELIKINNEELTPIETERLANEAFNHAKIDSPDNKKGEYDFSFSLPKRGRYRVNVYVQRGSYAIAIRLIPMDIPSLEDLNIPEVVSNLWNKTRGLVLVTGPTGCGKSTTLASIINLINSRRTAHIITLEDPIEYLHKHNLSVINQREIGIDSDNFANALRAALREDPDIILVGEMRDTETIATALTAAETGHLVFGTLHTMGAAKTIDRIIDSFPGGQQQQVRIQLASVLQAVITQQLIPNRDSMVPAFEIMICTHAISNLIREAKIHQIDNVIQTGSRFGMQTMDGYLVTLYKKGFISRNDVITYCFDPEIMEKII